MNKRIKKISRQLIEDSFPQLKGRNILYLTMYLRFYALSIWIPPFLRIIVVSTRTKHLDDNILTGILAHELCHQERYIEMGLFRYLGFILFYSFSKKVQNSEERATDTLTIRKGYARQLYELTLITARDKNHRRIIGNYLTPAEIKAYALEIGKWESENILT